MANTKKQAGIWMDHSTAHIMEYDSESIETNVIDSAFTHEAKAESLSKSENVMHNKEQHERAEFYKQIGEVIRNYNEVLLFGPTSAKSELYNLLKKDHRFEQINIEVKQADKMSEHQLQAFVKQHFGK